MTDYSVDGDFDIYFTENNSLAEVDGLEEFEEDLIISIDAQLSDVIGGYKNVSTVQERVSLLAVRVARQSGVVEQLRNIRVFELENEPESLGLEIIYYSGQTFQETI